MKVYLLRNKKNLEEEFYFLVARNKTEATVICEEWLIDKYEELFNYSKVNRIEDGFYVRYYDTSAEWGLYELDDFRPGKVY